MTKKTLLLIFTHVKPLRGYRHLGRYCHYISSNIPKRFLGVGGITFNEKKDCLVTNKNFYCELSGLYYAWKHLTDADYVGLAHYRRFFVNETNSIYKEKELNNIMQDCDVIVPMKFTMKSRTNYEHYKVCRNEDEILEMINSLSRISPNYRSNLLNFLNNKSYYPYNMFVMKTKLFDDYCSFLFPILFEIEKVFGKERPRLYGYIGEYLLNVWLEAQNDLKVRETSILLAKPKKTIFQKFKACCKVKNTK